MKVSATQSRHNQFNKLLGPSDGQWIQLVEERAADSSTDLQTTVADVNPCLHPALICVRHSEEHSECTDLFRQFWMPSLVRLIGGPSSS